MRKFRSGIATLMMVQFVAVGGAVVSAAESGPNGKESIGPRIAEMELRSGLVDLYIDEKKGEVWLRLPESESAGELLGSYIYVEGLSTGLGSNPIGLDRGQLGDARVIELHRVGEKVLFVEPNLSFRAISDNPLEREATRQSFAPSVLWAGVVEGGDSGGPEYVNLTSFIVRDAHGVTATLKDTEQGTFLLDPERSAIDLSACLAFPENVVMEAMLTYAGDDPGRHVRMTVPTPQSVTLIQRHTLVRLPDDGYKVREHDPRAGSFSVRFQDYAAPLDESIDRRWIVRHRLDKVRPGAASSEVVEPIVYYVDPGIPEPIRAAVFEGAGWWAQAFEAAGFEGGYRVELLPEDVHPLDVRYNVIEWVHRSTRGWSYGGGVVDPRTGEMLKAHVNLGSLRVRQDRLLFEGLAGTTHTGSGSSDDPVQLALARIRQLAAHEVGHTLGLNHNFAASTWGRASVMDYPAPLVQVAGDGSLDFSDAYGVGVGAWDLHTIRWAYAQFDAGQSEREVLDAIVHEGLSMGYVYLTDQDARPAGAAHPLANLWDNGEDPVAELGRLMEVRRIALDQFGQDNLAEGQPLALLEEVLVPLYLHHRYQVLATAKSVGGLVYGFNLRGDGQALPEPVAPQDQRRALKALLATLDPSELDLSEAILQVLPPRSAGSYANREMFLKRTSPGFDALGAAATAADLTVSTILQPQRAARMVDFHRRDSEYPDFSEALEGLIDAAFPTASEASRRANVRHSVQQVVVSRLMTLATDPDASPAVVAQTEAAIRDLADRLGKSEVGGDYAGHLAGQLSRFEERSHEPSPPLDGALDLPPGDPIGSNGPDLGSCSWNPLT